MEKMKKAEYASECRRRYHTKELNNGRAKDCDFRRLWRRLEINETIQHQEAKRKTARRQIPQQKSMGLKHFVVKNCELFNNMKTGQSKYSLRKVRSEKQYKERKIISNVKNKRHQALNKSVSTTKDLIKEVSSHIKQEHCVQNDTISQSLKIQPINGNLSEDNEDYANESIQKAYHEFLTTRMYLGKDYKRRQIIDYLKKDIPNSIKIKKENFEDCKDEVQIFEDESNIKLGLSERLDILQNSQQKYLCVKNLAKRFNCDIEDIHKTLKRHIKYVKEWEDIKLYSPHSSFSIEDLDTILYLWTCECIIKNYPITKNSIKHSAHPIAKILDLEMFKASDVWLDYFVNKYGVQLRNESQEVLGLAAEAIRIVKISDVTKKYSQTLSKCIQEKFVSTNTNKPYTYKKKMKIYDTSHAMFFRIKSNSSNLKTILEKTKIPEKLETNNFNKKSVLSNSVKQEPTFEYLETETFHKSNSTFNDDINLITSRKRSINLSLEENMNSVDSKKIKAENHYSTEVYTAPNISIESYEHALKYLKPLEEFVMLRSNFRAINYLNCLQNVLRELNKS